MVSQHRLDVPWDSIRGYDSSNLSSVIDRAKAMSGKTLNDLDIVISGQSTWNPKATGWAGNVIHRWFVDDDNDSAPDLSDVSHPINKHRGLEIKTVPLDRYGDGGNRAKWPQALAMIDYARHHDAPNPIEIEDSVIYSKDRWTLAVYYRYMAEDRPSGEILGIGLWDIESMEFSTIHDDYNTIRTTIREGRANELSERHTRLLSARTKSSSSSNRRSGGQGQPKAKPRAWALKTKYIRKRMEVDRIDFSINRQGDLETIIGPPPYYEFGTLQEDTAEGVVTADVVEFARNQLQGRTIQNVASELNLVRLGGKSVGRLVATRMLHKRPGGLGKEGKAQERFVGGHVLFVFNVNRNFRPANSGLKFPHIPLVDLCKESWEESSVFDLLDSLLLIPYTETKPLIVGTYLSPVLVELDDETIEKIGAEWTYLTSLIASGKGARRHDGKRFTNDLPGAKQTSYLHFRPCGRDGTVTEQDPLGNECTKMTLWLNASFVQKLLLDNYQKSGFSR